MKRFVLGLMGVAGWRLYSRPSPLSLRQPCANVGTATTHVKWDTQAVITMTLTPNYFAGFGQVKAVFGTQPAPTHGPNAGPGVTQGDIDFGDLLSGTDYSDCIQYAAHVNVTSNDPSGFKLYGEGSADFNQNGGAGTSPISSTLFYVTSTSGSPADPNNNGFSPGFPSPKDDRIPSSAARSVGPTSISYGGIYPGAPVANSATSTGDFYYDYLLKVPASIVTGGDYYVWIVYTVVGS